MRVRRVARGVRQMIVNHGWVATAQTAREQLRAKLRRRRIVAADPLSWQPTAEHVFDRENGVDTSGLIWGEELKSGSRNDVWNTAYYAVSLSVFHQVMAEVPARLLQGATFIDLGCGKGRAVLLATHYPFAHVMGVEIAPRLHGVAVENVARYAAVSQTSNQHDGSSPSVSVVLEDAARFRFPDGPLVVYLYHPFCRPVLEQVMRNLGQSLAEKPREAVVIYINHELRDVLDRTPYLERIWSATVEMAAIDRLADRVGSSAEDSAIYVTGA